MQFGIHGLEERAALSSPALSTLLPSLETLQDHLDTVIDDLGLPHRSVEAIALRTVAHYLRSARFLLTGALKSLGYC